MKTAWQNYYSKKKQWVILISSVILLLITLFSFKHFLTFTENRIGFLFNDPVLNLFAPINISLITFTATYLSAIIGIGIAIRSPELFIKLMQGYTILIWLRMLCLYFVPLEPPVHIIPLHDIFLQSSFYSGRDNLKDLFFSGHTATMFLFAFLFTDKKLKWIYTSAAVVIGGLVMLQHVHYSIDVFAAPLFAFFAISAQQKIGFLEDRM